MLSNADGFEFEQIAGAPARPDHRDQRGDAARRLREAVEACPDDPGVEGSADYFSPWDEQTELIAAAPGKPDEGKALVQRVKDRYRRSPQEHPEFKGKTATFSQNGFYNGLIYVYPEGSTRTS